jgi:hypothetical protein
MVYDLENNEIIQSLKDALLDKNRKSEHVRVARQLSALTKVDFLAGEQIRTSVKAKASDIQEILANPVQNIDLEKEYMLGPSVNIESVIVNNIDYAVRQYSSSKLAVLISGNSIGSCPYIYTYSSERAAWVNEGHVLYNINDKLKETTEEMRLTRFDGRILLKEKDPEISFIDLMYIKAVSLDGRSTIYHPNNYLLRHQDRNYLKLRQGEEIELKFEMPTNFTAQKYSVVIKGYYTPLGNQRLSAKLDFIHSRSLKK